MHTDTAGHSRMQITDEEVTSEGTQLTALNLSGFAIYDIHPNEKTFRLFYEFDYYGQDYATFSLELNQFDWTEFKEQIDAAIQAHLLDDAVITNYMHLYMVPGYIDTVAPRLKKEYEEHVKAKEKMAKEIVSRTTKNSLKPKTFFFFLI